MTKSDDAQSIFGLMASSRGPSPSFLERLFSSRRRKEQRELAATMISDLIENADEHMLRDIGVRREDLFRMRAALFEK